MQLRLPGNPDGHVLRRTSLYRPFEARWCNAHDSECGAVKIDLLTNNRWIAAEALLPVPMANHGGWARSRPVVVLCEHTAAPGVDTQDCKVVARHCLSLGHAGPPIGIYIETHTAKGT